MIIDFNFKSLISIKCAREQHDYYNGHVKYVKL